MRRKEKEITDREVIESILRNSRICTVAISDSDYPHIVPMNYGYSANCLWFHSAPEGRKIELLKGNGRVSFMIEDSHSIIPAETACGWTTEYRSLMGTGHIEIIDDEPGKKEGLDIIMAHHGAEGKMVYIGSQIARMVILQLTIETLACKQSDGYQEAASPGRAILEYAKQLKSLADTGLVYQDNPFDRERYTAIRETAFRLMANVTEGSPEKVRSFYSDIKEYPTPKVDVRGLVVNEKGEILMVREMADSRWTIPGGWADIGLSPSEVAVKEVREESGLEVTAKRLLAVYDKRCHHHPPSPYYIYKIVILCEVKGGILQPGFDILDAGWYSKDNLPELSTDRILEEQIAELYDLYESGEVTARFD